MGDTRIDGSTPRTLGTCDEETGICGAVKKDEPQVSKPDPQVSHPGDDWYSPMLPEEKPAQLAQIAKNMSAPKPPTHTERLATYDKMSDTQLEEALKPLQKKLQTPNYAGAAEDMERFKAIEQVMGNRNAAIENEKHKDDDAWRTPNLYARATKDSAGWEAGIALGDGGTMPLQAGVEVSTQHIGTKIVGFHEQKETKVSGVDVSVSSDVGTAHYGFGFKNSDGSKGLHVGGTATSRGMEATAHKAGVGSVTLGAGAGQSAELSVGLKKEGAVTEACARVDFEFFTVGACVRVWKD